MKSKEPCETAERGMTTPAEIAERMGFGELVLSRDHRAMPVHGLMFERGIVMLCDECRNSQALVYPVGFVLGAAIESVTIQAMMAVRAEVEAFEREHAHPALKKSRWGFRIPRRLSMRKARSGGSGK